MKFSELDLLFAALPRELLSDDVLQAARETVVASEVASLGFERWSEGDRVDFGYAIEHNRLEPESATLPTILSRYKKDRHIGRISPLVFLEYDLGDQSNGGPHCFFRDLRMEWLGSSGKIIEFLLKDQLSQNDRSVSALQHLLLRLPADSRSGYLGVVRRTSGVEIRCQFPISTNEVSKLLSDCRVDLTNSAEAILGALRSADIRRINLQLAMSDGCILPRLGVEVGITRWVDEPPPGWPVAIEAALGQKRADAFREELDLWWGVHKGDARHARWSHFKLSTGEEIEIKHYLWVQTLEAERELANA